MTPPITTEKTSRAGLERQLRSEASECFPPTGWELGQDYQVVISWGTLEAAAVIEVVPAAPNDAPADLAGQAAALAVDAPQVESAPVPAPRLTGNLAEDVHDVCGLTWEQIAQIFKVSERAAAGWRAQGVPSHRQGMMEALRTIGTTLVGGLGPDGVAHWLTAGTPSRLRRLRAGEITPVADEARSYLDGPAT